MKMTGMIVAFLAGTTAFGETPVRDTRVFVDGAECRNLKALGEAAAVPREKWTEFSSKGNAFANRWLTDASIGPGNFLLKIRFSMPNPVFCCSTIRIGSGDRELIVSLQNVNGLFSVAGPLVNADLDTGRVSRKLMHLKKDKVVDLAIERMGDQLSISSSGRLIRRQTVTDSGLGPVCIAPMRGTLRIERMEVTANFLPFETPVSLPINKLCKVKMFAPLEPLPSTIPIPQSIRLKDGSLLAITEGGQASTSQDEGKTWSKSKIFRDKKFRLYDEYSAVCMADGTVVVMFINIGERKRSWDVQKNRPNADMRLPTYCVRSLDGGKTWEDPILMSDDYSGCQRGMIETKAGRLVAMVQHLDYEEGRNYSQPFWSDDKGKTWHAANAMDCGGEHGDHSGLIEATLIQLKDGRIWTLLRSGHGFFHEAFSSDDGRTWTPLPPEKSKIASTGSPGMLKRMSDGSIILLYNAIPTEGYERREELFVSFSEDEGISWTKPFVIARNPGARVAYPYVFERIPGELWITTMQGGLRARAGLAELKAAVR